MRLHNNTLRSDVLVQREELPELLLADVNGTAVAAGVGDGHGGEDARRQDVTQVRRLLRRAAVSVACV